MSTVVVYVHGLWLHGYEAMLLRRRLAKSLGAETRSFTYSSVGATVTDNARALERFLAQIPAETLHLVGHSLGGLVILKLFELEGSANGPMADGSMKRGIALPPGRVVLLGSPVRGSRSARRLARLPFGRAILGVSAAEALLAPRDPRWDGARGLGVIAGDLAVGLGRLLGPMRASSDGTVLVEETDLPGAAEQLRLRVSHIGMPYSAEVARQVAVFLREGRFAR
jgi:pimeloyl-ACP methyl ester carboxylesterase